MSCKISQAQHITVCARAITIHFTMQSRENHIVIFTKQNILNDSAINFFQKAEV